LCLSASWARGAILPEVDLDLDLDRIQLMNITGDNENYCVDLSFIFNVTLFAGGGVSGCHVARELASRGCSTALITKDLLGGGGSYAPLLLSIFLLRHFDFRVYLMRFSSHIARLVGGRCAL